MAGGGGVGRVGPEAAGHEAGAEQAEQEAAALGIAVELGHGFFRGAELGGVVGRELRRRGQGSATWKTNVPRECIPDKAALKALQEFLPGVQANLLFGGELRYCPDFPDLSRAKGIAVLRSGLHLGTAKGKIFVPDHAWAVSINPPDVPRVHLTEEQARLYQNGQVVPADAKGWVLACYAGIPLGWGKVSDGMMKNHYPKGLRR